MRLFLLLSLTCGPNLSAPTFSYFWETRLCCVERFCPFHFGCFYSHLLSLSGEVRRRRRGRRQVGFAIPLLPPLVARVPTVVALF